MVYRECKYHLYFPNNLTLMKTSSKSNEVLIFRLYIKMTDLLYMVGNSNLYQVAVRS
jgi:hypothetical protein